MQRTINSFDKTKINYNISRHSKEFLIFIHGAGGDLSAWNKERTYFHRKGISTLAIDLRGHGKSERPNKLEDYRLAKFAKDINEIIKKENIKKFIIVGHSFGGVITIKFHELFPKKSKAYILIATTHKSPKSIKKMFKQKGFVNLINKFLSKTSSKKGSHVDFNKFVGTKDYSPRRILSDITHTSFKSWFFTYQSLSDFNLTKSLNKMKQSVLIIEGEKDSIFKVPVAKKMHKLLKHSKLDIIPKANHMIVINNPKAIKKEILEFIKKQKFPIQ